MVHLPAPEVRTIDVPPLALSVRREDERALACANQYPYLAHPHSDSRLRRVFGKTVQAAGPAALMRIACRDGLEHGLVQGQLRLRAVLGEAHRHQRFVARLALRIFPGPGEHEPFWLRDLAIDALQPMVEAVARAHAETKDSPS